MSALVWVWAFVYVAGHLVLWHRVERGRQQLRVARRFTVAGFLGWIALVVIAVATSLAQR